MVIAFDANVILAALLGWHEHHARALPVVDGALAGPDRVVLPLPALIEAYAVMTRLPVGKRLRPEDALALLDGTFRDQADVIALDGPRGWRMLESAVARAVAGGATYDAHVAACAIAGGAHRLVTFNERHFRRLDLGAMVLVVP